MKKSKSILGLKSPGDFTQEERIMIIEDYLSSGKTKQEIWEKYTGQKEEHGSLLKWMRKLGYLPNENKSSNFEQEITDSMAKSNQQYSSENKELKEKIKFLEKALVESELRSSILDTMIEVAEKELGIPIRKKSFTQHSIK